jgi:hydroxyacylglutathione hydrolase
VHQVADGVFQIALTPRNGVNAYLLGDVIVDAGTAGQGKKLVKILTGKPVAAHTITHSHLDHIGGSAHVVRELGVPFWAPAGDAQAARDGSSPPGESFLKPLLARGGKFKPVPVARELNEGDDVAGFTVLDVPGHSPGHIAFWREADRVLVAGDVFFTLSLKTFRYGLRQPPGPFTVDPEQNRRSMKRLADLEPAIACFGHGPPVTGAAPKLRACVASF